MRLHHFYHSKDLGFNTQKFMNGVGLRTSPIIFPATAYTLFSGTNIWLVICQTMVTIAILFNHPHSFSSRHDMLEFRAIVRETFLSCFSFMVGAPKLLDFGWLSTFLLLLVVAITRTIVVLRAIFLQMICPLAYVTWFHLTTATRTTRTFTITHKVIPINRRLLSRRNSLTHIHRSCHTLPDF